LDLQTVNKPLTPKQRRARNRRRRQLSPAKRRARMAEHSDLIKRLQYRHSGGNPARNGVLRMWVKHARQAVALHMNRL